MLRRMLKKYVREECNHVEHIYNLGTMNFLFITFDAELLVT